jgi:hypothetical protein
MRPVERNYLHYRWLEGKLEGRPVCQVLARHKHTVAMRGRVKWIDACDTFPPLPVDFDFVGLFIVAFSEGCEVVTREDPCPMQTEQRYPH